MSGIEDLKYVIYCHRCLTKEEQGIPVKDEIRLLGAIRELAERVSKIEQERN